MKTIKITRITYFIGILFLGAQLSLSAQVQPDQLKKLEGEWIVLQKHTSKHRGEHKVETESTNYSAAGSDKLIYNFTAPNQLIITEIENKNGKEETDIDHYEIKKLDNNLLEVVKLNDDDLVKEVMKATWKINNKDNLVLTFKRKKTFSKTVRTRVLTLTRDNRNQTR